MPDTIAMVCAACGLTVMSILPCATVWNACRKQKASSKELGDKKGSSNKGPFRKRQRHSPQSTSWSDKRKCRNEIG